MDEWAVAAALWVPVGVVVVTFLDWFLNWKANTHEPRWWQGGGWLLVVAWPIVLAMFVISIPMEGAIQMWWWNR